MRRLAILPRRLRRDARGVTIVEFALVSPVLMMVIMGLSEICYQAYATAIVTGALQKAGRDSTLETGAANSAALDADVITAVRRISKTATYTATRKSYSSFAAVKPEDYSDTNKNGVRDATECYTDANGNGSWDADGGKTGLGGADDVVVYEMTVSYPRLFPLAKLLGWSGPQTITARTVLKNQPFQQQNVPTPVVRCT